MFEQVDETYGRFLVSHERHLSVQFLLNIGLPTDDIKCSSENIPGSYLHDEEVINLLALDFCSTVSKEFLVQISIPCCRAMYGNY
jgi:hypothetical protein